MAKQKRIRYAVVGLGYISQIAMLPAFKHARRNSELVALVSSETEKLRALGRKYGVSLLCGYNEYEELLRSGDIDAVYIATPNNLHVQFVAKACQAGVHVLCEKPMEVNETRCREMVRAARDGEVKLMIAYRLHFEEANLTAVHELKKGRIGEPRIFNSTFSQGVDPRNYRAGPRAQGGGPLYDLGVYCVNAARYLFESEPVEVMGMSFGRERAGKSDSELTFNASLRFEKGQAANFSCSFGGFEASRFEVIGTKGVLTLERAYEMTGSKCLKIETKSGVRTKKYPPRDQFGPELLYFSDCILKDREPEPSGVEGLEDVRIIEALFRSADLGQAVSFEPIERPYPSPEQEIDLPAVKKEELVSAAQSSRKEAA